MRKKKNKIFTSGYVALLAAIALLAASPGLYIKSLNRNLRKELEETLPALIEEQEETLGIKHYQTPSVECYWRDFSDCNLSFYNPKTDKIVVNSKHILWGFGSPIRRDKESTKDERLRLQMHHELAHSYEDSVYERITGSDLVCNDNSGTRAIAEGIARYFERKINNPDVLQRLVRECPQPDPEYSRLYENSYDLVKPILDEFGVEKGVEYLLQNPPKIEDGKSFDSQGYIDRVTNELRSKN
jgi:hypothetical protein